MKNLWQALMMVRQCSRRSFWLRILYVFLQRYIVEGVTSGAVKG